MTVLTEATDKAMKDVRLRGFARRHKYVRNSTYDDFQRAFHALFGATPDLCLGYEASAYLKFADYFAQLGHEAEAQAAKKVIGEVPQAVSLVGGTLGLSAGALLMVTGNLAAGELAMGGGGVFWLSRAGMLGHNKSIENAKKKRNYNLERASQLEQQSSDAAARTEDVEATSQQELIGQYLDAAERVAVEGTTRMPVASVEHFERRRLIETTDVDVFNEYAALSMFRAHIRGGALRHPLVSATKKRFKVVQEISVLASSTRALLNPLERTLEPPTPSQAPSA